MRPGIERWYRRQWATALRRLRETVEGELPVERLAVSGGDRIPGAG
jgi:hypothetical protein